MAPFVGATPHEINDFVEKIVREAGDLIYAEGIPMPAVLGMACYESTYGKDHKAQDYFVLFGITKPASWVLPLCQQEHIEWEMLPTIGVVGGHRVQAPFCIAQDIPGAIKVFLSFAYSAPGSTPDRLTTAKSSPEQFVRYMKAVGNFGAGNPNYVKTVMDIIHEKHLTKYSNKLP